MLKNKKGFVLIEAIVVIVVISISLITLYKSYNRILTKVTEENKYELSEHLYMTHYIKSFLKDNNCDVEVYDLDSREDIYNKEINCNGVSKKISNIFRNYEIKHIYIIKNINSANTYNNLKNFDAYMIDYIKALDVDDNLEIIVVEYYKKSKDSNYNDIKVYGTNKILHETYIASLEW